MTLDCKKVLEDFGLHQNPDLTHQERAEYKKHLIECPTCQAKYEKMLHTAAVLESLPHPVPPLDLAERIQTQIRHQTHRRSVLDFFANPIARILVALRLGPHPTFVNYTALLFYLMLTVFLVKLTFFSSTHPVSVITLKPQQPKIRIIALGNIKQAALKSTSIEEEVPKEIAIPLK